MKIGIQTWGSDGDIRPFIALSGGLSSAGHDVTLTITSVDNKNYSSFGDTLRFKTIPAADRFFYGNQERLLPITYELKKTKDPIKQLKIILNNFFDPVIDDIYTASKKLCEENDIIIGHFLLYPLVAAAEKSGKPFVPVVLCHGVIPSIYITPSDAPNLGRFVNAFFWKIGGLIFDMYFKQNINNFRKREGLAPIKRVLRDSWESKALNLIAVSPCLCEPKPDWNNRYKVCGFFNIPGESEKWDMPEDLAKFLNSGAEPVYMTFGSMVTVAQDTAFLKESAQLMADAVNLAGCRAIIQFPWDKITGIPERHNIYRITRAPHNLIFNRCSAVVHHGGAGTTQSATMSGCPSIVVAHIADQEFWGKELNRIGIAPKVLYRRSVTSQRLAREIEYVLAHPAMKEKAKKIGDIMRDENGVKQAVKFIESSFRR